MIRYKHAQFGWVIVIGLLLVGVITLVIALGQNDNVQEIFRLRLGMSVFLFFCILLFYNLKTSVTDKEVFVVFGIGLVRKKILLEEIEHCEAKKGQFVLGWGLRYRWDYTLWNVSGFDAVELTLRGKKRKFRIGTDKPEELSAAITAGVKELSLSAKAG